MTDGEIGLFRLEKRYFLTLSVLFIVFFVYKNIILYYLKYEVFFKLLFETEEKVINLKALLKSKTVFYLITSFVKKVNWWKTDYISFSIFLLLYFNY